MVVADLAEEDGLVRVKEEGGGERVDRRCEREGSERQRAAR